MPCTGCSALHGVHHNEKKKKKKKKKRKENTLGKIKGRREV